MAVKNGAQEAPRGSFTRALTGFRRLTPGLLKADHSAESFDGLPEGVESPGQLLAAFKAAAPRLGIASRLVHAVDWLFRFTQPKDWERGARPIVWPSASVQQEALSLSPTQVKEINRRLIELGLVTMKDSPNGKRYGKRDPNGRIIEAYGFDLSPIAARHGEFVRVAEEARAERVTISRLRRRATIARKAIIQIRETAADFGFDAAEWQTLARETEDLTRALRAVERPDEMEVGVKSLERRQTAARERLEFLLGTVESDPKGAENRPHQYTYNTNLNPHKDTVIATSICSGEGERSDPQPPTLVPSKRPDETVHGIWPDELVRLTPKLGLYLRRPDPTWADIIDAAAWLREDLGVSKSLWGDACLTMGRELAAAALAVVSTKNDEYFRTSPGGYFHGMVAKAKAGDLHLERTLWALRRATAPERPAGRREMSKRREGHQAW